MKINPNLALIAALAVGAYWFVLRPARRAAALVGDFVTDPENPFHAGVNATGAAVSGDPHFSLGSWLYELTHPNEPDPTEPTPLRSRGR